MHQTCVTRILLAIDSMVIPTLYQMCCSAFDAGDVYNRDDFSKTVEDLVNLGSDLIIYVSRAPPHVRTSRDPVRIRIVYENPTCIRTGPISNMVGMIYQGWHTLSEHDPDDEGYQNKEYSFTPKLHIDILPLEERVDDPDGDQRRIKDRCTYTCINPTADNMSQWIREKMPAGHKDIEAYYIPYPGVWLYAGELPDVLGHWNMEFCEMERFIKDWQELHIADRRMGYIDPRIRSDLVHYRECSMDRVDLKETETASTDQDQVGQQECVGRLKKRVRMRG